MEMGGKKQICRLCLEIVPPGDAEAIGEKKKEILEVLLINVDLHIIDNAVACSRCMEELQSGFEFKSACFHVDNCISTSVVAGGPVADMKKIFQGEMRGTAMANVNLENRQICRLCMSLIEDRALDCNTDVKDIIANCLPEVDIYTVQEPLVCELCFSRMKKLNEFMNNCQEVERRINNYYLHSGVDHAILVSVNLNDLLKFNDNTISELIKGESSNFESNLLKDPKKEDTASIECEEIHIKDELDSVDEVGDAVPSGAYNNSGGSGSLKRKRQMRQFTSKVAGKKHFSSDGHMAKHRGLNKEFACQECTYKTNSKASLARHIFTHKDKSEVQHMARNRDSRAERKLKCDKCTYKTDFKSHLLRHYLMHKDKSEVEMHKCGNCEFETRYKNYMKQHMLSSHGDPKAERKFKCDKCTYKTDFKSRLHRHNLIHKDKSEVEMHKCGICAYETRYKSAIIQHTAKHRDTRPERKFKCDKCAYETNFKYDLCRHYLRHEDKLEVEILKCYNCAYETRHKWNMNRHLRRHMVKHRDLKDKSEVEMHKCENCEFETRYKNYMKQHMLSSHGDPTAERKFECDKCTFKTDFKSRLRRHNLMHKDKSEVEMHKCDTCEYETRYKSAINQHVAKHRDTTAERKFKCDKCTYETNFKYDLCRHYLRHKDKLEVEMLKCHNCGYETRYKCNMNRHLRGHKVKHHDLKVKSEVEMHECENCGYETRYKSNLNRHMLKHSDAKI